MLDLAAMQAQIDALTAQLAALSPAAPPPPVAVPVEPEPPRPVRLHVLTRGVELGGLHRDVREVRRLVEAVALAKGVRGPSESVPADWLPQLRALAAARAAGESWIDALTQAGLEVPGDLTEQARVVRLEAAGLWDKLLPLVGVTFDGVNSVAQDRLKSFLKRALA